MLIGLSWLVRFKIIPSLLPFASLFHFVINMLRWGEHRGGMFVLVTGTGSGGERVERSWHLLAEKGDGPLIPSMAVNALILQILSNKQLPTGARPAIRELEVKDYEDLFKVRTIYSGQRESNMEDGTPLYQRMLDSVWQIVPAAVRKMHTTATAKGVARVEVGNNPLAILIRAVFDFPKAGDEVPVTVTFQQKDSGELWQRTFANKTFSSFQKQGQGYYDKLILENFGPFTVAMALVWEDEKLKLIVRHWHLFGIRLPLFLAPNGDTFEYEKDGIFHFNVEVKQVLTGLIMRYQGHLIPD